ncbi:ABC transporter permease [Haliea sp. AH-315-K21]|uniref:Transport permease protein n=1 Tax=SAR86 cluster bacterium TaxID=2030880 RepID=A0A2A5CD60_9GAMM|nr:ABC transporter permease [Haliea sp. AH-315-K21]MBN4075943.1 ABC transporter permease [Gammaproteobacteria bacterium AH-315-E17]PCJ41807.1 MAG: ABC transporter [SAR86 cluster bacterium]PCJ43816.1 MAG: ABC transporter [SAR86 cluster bacterium]
MKSLLRLYAIFHKEFTQLLRDRLTFGMIVGIPLIQLVLFGFAINTDVRNLTAALVDQADTSLSRQMVSDMTASQVVDFQYRVATIEELTTLMDQGSISIGLYIPPDFDRRILDRNRVGAGGNRAAAQILVDGTDPIILGVGRQLANIPVSFDSTRRLQGSVGLEVRNFYNPERRSAVNIVPGLIGVILTMTMVLFTAVAIVREKERGNMEFLINTPVKSLELMLGKILPYVVIGFIQVSLILILGWFLFRVPVQGSLIDVYLATMVFIAANLALGLLISTSAQTQFQAMQMTFFFFLPSILLSGFMFPFDGMPKAAQAIAEVLPLTHFNRIIRNIMLRGAEIDFLSSDILALLAFAFIALSIAIMRFNKRLD